MTTASKDARLLLARLTNKSLPPIPRPVPTTTTVLVGSEKTRFKLDRDRLCAVSAFFHDRLGAGDGQLWLPAESAAAFGLLVKWLHGSSSLDDVVAVARAKGSKAARELHWPLVSLHLLASRLQVDQLQDQAMDLLQDLYLACDWHVAPSLVAYLYDKCDVMPAVRIRRWVVAMLVAAAAAASHDEDDVDVETRTKLGSLPDFVTDYERHLASLARAGLDVRLKDARRRIGCNRLRNHERRFAFRRCSFHVHRAAVGEGPCPHDGRDDESCPADEDGKPGP
ncbi:hypothetical protein CP533_5837 [Ophiocordyceps camponoti-saundersi (nom. inval.)]|nr:hypothetical protein CP533_5837 [Ophiocordyceps camponoti-saundersi (nom. inval.)]